MQAVGYKQLVQEPTRIVKNSEPIIILSNQMRICLHG